MPTRERITHVSTYDSTANEGQGAWDVAVPIGAESDNIDISTAITSGGDGSLATNEAFNSSNVLVAANNTGTTAWSKFNTFVQRVNTQLQSFIGANLRTAYNNTYGNKDVYSALVLNNYMNNVIGYTGTSTPSAGKISTQISNKLNLDPPSIELRPASGATNGGFIDFHYGGTNTGYTSRIIESSSGTIKANGLYISENTLTMGSASTSSEVSIRTTGKAGQIYFYSQASTTGSRGIWLINSANSSSTSLVTVDQNNSATFYGALSGNANTATTATTALRLRDPGNSSYNLGLKYSGPVTTTPYFAVWGDQTGLTKVVSAMTPQNVRNVLGLGNTTGPVPVLNGGTGANNQLNALINLGAPYHVHYRPGANKGIKITASSNSAGFVIIWNGNHVGRCGVYFVGMDSNSCVYASVAKQNNTYIGGAGVGSGSTVYYIAGTDLTGSNTTITTSGASITFVNSNDDHIEVLWLYGTTNIEIKTV